VTYRDQYELELAGERRSPEWKKTLAKKRGTKRTRELAFKMQAPTDRPLAFNPISSAPRNSGK
jgi:hypothetical protein